MVVDSPAHDDVNAAVAGYLRDLAFAQAAPAQMYGYKRAAAAIHSLDTPLTALIDAEDQTDRLLGAIKNPRVRILAHPRGRITGSRGGVAADWDTVFAAAARHGVAIEIDGDPARQDVDYSLAARAMASGCIFALDSDAHTTAQLAYAETAVAHARLAGIPPGRIVNCWPLEQLLAWLVRRANV